MCKKKKGYKGSVKAYLLKVYQKEKLVGYFHYRHGHYVLGASRIGAALWLGEDSIKEFIKKNSFRPDITVKSEALINNKNSATNETYRSTK